MCIIGIDNLFFKKSIMNNNIEQLKTEVDDIKKSLNDLKTNVDISETEKKTKAEALKSQAETTKQKIQKEINDLSNQSGQWVENKKEEAEALLNSFNEIMSLYDSIMNTWNNVPTQQQVLPETENKWVFSEAKDRIWDQWSDIWNKEKWETEKWKNLLRTVWFTATWVWAIALAYKWIKKLFWWWKDEEEEDDEEETKPKKKKKKGKSFRKYLKWWWIAAWGWFLINKIWKRLGRWGKEGATGRDSDKEKSESYEEFIRKPENKEKFNNYEWLWDKIDNVYQEIYNKELQSWYEDELEMKKISEEQSKWTNFYKWIVPYCLDNQFKSVEGILWQNSSFKTALNAWLDWMINFVKNTWWEFLQLFADCYLEFLPSWLPFKGMVWSLGDKIEQRKIKNKDAEKEMQYFFRQSIRVQTYLRQKRNQLTKKIVKEAAQKYWKSEDEIWNDKDLFKKYIEVDPQYQNFLNSPTHSAVTVLAQNNMFDNHIDEDLKDQIKEIDKDRSRILWSKEWEKDIVEIIYNKKQKSESLDTNDDKKLWEACGNMLNSMDDIIEAVEDWARNIYWDLIRNWDANMREYLVKSWLDKMFESYKQILLSKKQELENGKLSNEDKIALSESINAMLALKKEAELWQTTLEKDYDEYGNIIYRVPWFLYWSVKNLIKWVWKLIHGDWWEWLAYISSWFIWTWWAIVLVWWVRCLLDAKSWKKIASFGWKMMFSPAWVTFKWVSQVKPIRDFGHRVNPLKYRWKKWAETLLQDLVDWRVSLDRAWKIINKRSFPVFWSKETETVRKGMFHVTEDMKKWFDMRKVAFDSIVKKQVNENYLSDIKKDSQLYDELVKNWDIKPEIANAVKAQKSINELKRVSNLSSAWGAAEVVWDVRRAFDANIDKAIKRLDEWGNKNLAKVHIDKLRQLQAEDLAEDEMKSFVKFMDDWFDAKLIPELKKLFSITDEAQNIWKIWDHLKKLLSEWNYTEFKWVIKQTNFSKFFKWIEVNNLVDNFDKVLLKWAKQIWEEWIKLLKSVTKILAKVL